MLALPLHLFTSIILSSYITPTIATTTADFASRCYSTTLPPLTPLTENRTIPWSSPSLELSNGTICCDSLDQVRDGIDDIDEQLLGLLALRAGYVREATRFKATLDTVDVPSRDASVIQEAVDKANSTTPPLSRFIAKGVFEAILNFSVPFEECIVSLGLLSFFWDLV